MSVTTKLGRMVTYNEGNSPIMSHDLLTTGSLEVKLKFFIIVGLGKQSLISTIIYLILKDCY